MCLRRRDEVEEEVDADKGQNEVDTTEGYLQNNAAMKKADVDEGKIQMYYSGKMN